MSTKNSKPVRVRKDLLNVLSKYKSEEEPWSDAIERIIEQATGPVGWTYPEMIFRTRKEAAIYGLEQAAIRGMDYEELNPPIKVRES